MADTRDDAAQWERQIQLRLARGEAAALGELYDRHGVFVHGLAARLLPEEKAARELVSEVFAHLWSHPQHFDPAAVRLRRWLAAETHRRATTRLAGVAAAPGPRAAVPAPAAQAAQAAQAPGVPQGLGELMEMAGADSALRSMPVPVRTALLLVHSGDLNYHQAAAELGITDAEVCRRLRVGLRLVAAARSEAGEDGR